MMTLIDWIENDQAAGGNQRNHSHLDDEQNTRHSGRSGLLLLLVGLYLHLLVNNLPLSGKTTYNRTRTEGSGKVYDDGQDQ